MKKTITTVSEARSATGHQPRIITSMRLDQTDITRIYNFRWCEHLGQLVVHTQSGKAESTSVNVTVSHEGVYMRSIYNVTTVNDPEFVRACQALNVAHPVEAQFLCLLESRIVDGMTESA